jgi:hypothetical protein
MLTASKSLKKLWDDEIRFMVEAQDYKSSLI